MPGYMVGQQSHAELVGLTAVLVLACVGGAIWARTRAPAVTIGLLVGLITGAVTFVITASQGQHGVPLVVLMTVSIGFAGSGFLTLWFRPAQRRVESLRRKAVGVLVAAPVVGLVALFFIQQACPLYVTRGAGFCYYEDDVLGGWSAGAAVIISLDLMVLGIMLLVTDYQARRSESSILEADPSAGMLTS